MRYVSSNLLSGEQVEHLARLHWIVFRGPFIVLLFSLFMLCGSAESAGASPGFFMIAAAWGAMRLMKFVTSEFAVTNKRLVVKTGLIRRKTLELLLEKVETIAVRQGLLGRIFGYGTIVVIGTGSTRQPFHKIGDPLLFRSKALEQISKKGQKPTANA